VAAIRGGRLVGFLTGWRFPSFRGKRSTFSPEWANAAEPEDNKVIYEEMYRHLAAHWVAAKSVAHYISVFPNDDVAISALHWLGFGMVAVDAVRNLEPIPNIEPDIQIRLAGLQDLEEIMALDEALWEHMKEAPAFLLTDKNGLSHFEGWVRDPNKSILMASNNGEPVAFMSFGPANEDVCRIIVEENTTSIYRAFTKKGIRGTGIATALLNQGLKLAGEAGYDRCAVDFLWFSGRGLLILPGNMMGR